MHLFPTADNDRAGLRALYWLYSLLGTIGRRTFCESRSRSETEGLLRLLRRPDANALQFQHAHLRPRAAGRRETADFAAGGEHPVTGNDQGRRIPRHRFPDVARGFAASANLLRQRAIRGGSSPADPAQGVIDLGKE